MKKTKKQYRFILIIFISLYVISTQIASAASVSFGAPATVNTGENLDVVIKLDSAGALINGLEFVIDYDENLLSFSGYSDDNAIVKLWIDPPREKDGKIFLSGIIPGGVLGLYDPNEKGNSDELKPIPLAHLLFTARQAGNANFSFTDSKILQNDGQGTPLPHDALEAKVTISDSPNGKKTDTAEPENAQKETLPARASSFFPVFLVIVIAIICGILGRKLLKYKL